MIKKLIKIWCWIVGHNWVTGSRFEGTDYSDQPISQWGHSECSRCGETHTWQWDQ